MARILPQKRPRGRSMSEPTQALPLDIKRCTAARRSPALQKHNLIASDSPAHSLAALGRVRVIPSGL